jgi:hypothetical protein
MTTCLLYLDLANSSGVLRAGGDCVCMFFLSWCTCCSLVVHLSVDMRYFVSCVFLCFLFLWLDLKYGFLLLLNAYCRLCVGIFVYVFNVVVCVECFHLVVWYVVWFVCHWLV